MNDIKLRSAKIEDLPILLEFEQGIISTERPFDIYLKEDPISYYDLKELILSDESELVVAVDESTNKIVGSGYAKIKDSLQFKTHDKHAFMGFMYVDPVYRGQGINKLIIDKLIIWSKSKNINHTILNVYSENDIAIKAYEKVGFKKDMVVMVMSI